MKVTMLAICTNVPTPNLRHIFKWKRKTNWRFILDNSIQSNALSISCCLNTQPNQPNFAEHKEPLPGCKEASQRTSAPHHNDPTMPSPSRIGTSRTASLRINVPPSSHPRPRHPQTLTPSSPPPQWRNKPAQPNIPLSLPSVLSFNRHSSKPKILLGSTRNQLPSRIIGA